jgi:hypothetical protein
MSEVSKKEKKAKKESKGEKHANGSAAAEPLAGGLHLKSEEVTAPVDTKDWPLLLKVSHTVQGRCMRTHRQTAA